MTTRHDLRNGLATFGVAVPEETPTYAIVTMLNAMLVNAANAIVDIEMDQEMELFHAAGNNAAPLCGAVHIPFDFIISAESGMVTCPHCLAIMQDFTWGYFYSNYAD
jgi:hypothetical protein